MNPSIAKRASDFKALHEANGAFVIPNPWDVGSARILAGLGYSALATSSQGFAFTIGNKDGNVPRDLMMEHCAQVVAAVDLPVSADLEEGYADTPEQVADTIELAGASGLAGCSIEDFSGLVTERLFSPEEAVARVEAAVAAAKNLPRDFCLTARAEGFLRGAPVLGEVIDRLNRYAQAGADVLYAPGLPDLQAVKTLCSAVDKPVNVLAVGALAKHSVAELADAGASRVSLGSLLSRHVLAFLERAARETLDLGTFTWTETLGQGKAIDGVMR